MASETVQAATEPEDEPTTPAPPVDPPDEGRRSRRSLLTIVPETAPLALLLVGLGVYFSIESEFFFNYDNFLNILTAAAITGIIAAPATLLLVGGQFDLSVGSGLTFCGIVMAYFVGQGEPLAVAIALAALAGMVLGSVNGFLVTVVGVNPLITTLGTLAAFVGLARVIADGQTLPVTGFSGLGTSRPIFDIPLPVLIFAAVVLAFWALMRFTVFGRAMYAIGANPEAARLAGIRVKRFIFIGFFLSGVCVALASLVNVSQLGAASPNAGSGLELSVITAVVLGGASLAGGRGTIIGTVFGLLVIATLNNGLVLLNVSSFWQDVARGSLLILAVSFDQLRLRLRNR
jgi:ribose transport system permease protein